MREGRKEGNLLCIVFVVGTEMKHLNIKNNVIVTAATPFMLATILVVASVGAATMIGINQSADAAAGTVGETAPAGTLAGCHTARQKSTYC
jgi:hypothetical protein